MKKIALIVLAAMSVALPRPLMAQAPAQQAAPDPNAPHKVGLVDMAEVFQGYHKFEDLRNELQKEIDASDAEAKAMLENLQKLQKDITDKNFAPGSAQYEQAEKQLLDAKGQFDSFRAATTRKLARRESDMFRVIYADTTSMVSMYAKHKGFTVVLRFDRKSIDEETAPAEAVQRMNKQVVYFRGEDDITDTVLFHLNSQYDKSRGTSTPVRPVSGTAAGNPAGAVRN